MSLLLLPSERTSTVTSVRAFSAATTRRRRWHVSARAAPCRSDSSLNVFRRWRRDRDAGGEGDDAGPRGQIRNGPDTEGREGVLRTEIKRFDAPPAPSGKEPRSARNDADRHAWKKKEKNLLERATYRWRGLAKRLRYVVHHNTVYVLELENGKYYVGSTADRRQRYREHFQGRRSAKWTRLHPPLRVADERRRVPSRYLMGAESQLTSQMMLRHGVNNVRGAGLCRAQEFTTDDLTWLVSYLGHYNQLDYDQLYHELLKVLPRPERSDLKVGGGERRGGKKRGKPMHQERNNTNLTEKGDGLGATKGSLNRTFQNYKAKQRKKQRKLRKPQSRCYKCGETGHWASECPNTNVTSADNGGTGFSPSVEDELEDDAAAAAGNGEA